jgi:hypothetical protein
MRYTASVAIAANTLEADPHEETLELCYGNIKRVRLLFPAGHRGLTHLQVFYQTRQIFPSSPGESFVGDNTAIDFPEDWPVYEPPFAVTLRGWNLCETYEHTIYVEMTVLPPVILVPTIVQPPALPGAL